ncbi:MAG: hypothetical protein M3139_18780, partial [Bacteroidota bacterium]|nr:hypothetical protein [Bacteroidota bacterium]
ITTGENGFLLENNSDEDKIVEEGIEALNKLSSNKSMLHAVGKNSRLYAEKHFSGKVFCENYKQVLLGE